MQLLVVSDIHSHPESVEKLRTTLLHNRITPDVLVCCGDFTQEGSAGIASQEVDTLKKIAPRVLAIPGNMDSEEVVRILEGRRVSIHKKCIEIEGINFIGLGGVKDVNTNYRFNVGELEAKKCLAQLFKDVKAHRTVLVTHAPPAGTKLEITGSGAKLGVNAIREIIEKKQPLLCLCGHAHEAKGQEMVKKTLCINPGPLMHGDAVLVEIPGLKVQRIEF